MSIENNIERIATALEALVGKLDHIGQAAAAPVEEPTTPKSTTPTPPQPAPVAAGASAPVTTAPAAAVPQPPPVQQATPAPTTPALDNTPVALASAITAGDAATAAQELNNAIVVEFKRLGGRVEIDKIMRDGYKAQSITDLTIDQYAPLLSAIQAVATP